MRLQADRQAAARASEEPGPCRRAKQAREHLDALEERRRHAQARAQFHHDDSLLATCPTEREIALAELELKEAQHLCRAASSRRHHLQRGLGEKPPPGLNHGSAAEHERLAALIRARIVEMEAADAPE